MSFAEAVKTAAKNSLCQAIAAQEAINDAINRLTGVPLPNPARAARGLICDNFDPPPVPQPNFQGGQCDGSNYSVTATLNARGVPNGPDIAIPVQTFAVGPISTISGETLPEGSSTRAQAFLVDKNGRKEFGGSSNSTFVSLTGITLTRFGGLPDDCGNPEPQPVPFPTGGIPVNPGPVSYTDDGGNVQIIVPTAVILPPIVNVKGEVNVPINVNIDGITFEANLNVNTGDINIGVGTDNNNRPRGDDSDEGDNSEVDGEPPSTGTPGEDLEEDQPEEGERRIFGVLVSTTTVSLQNRLTVLTQNNNPDIFVPSLGHINFQYRLGTGRVGAWSEDIKVKNRRQFIPCPWKYGAIDVVGTPQPGVQFTLTKVYDRIQEQVEDGVSL